MRDCHRLRGKRNKLPIITIKKVFPEDSPTQGKYSNGVRGLKVEKELIVIEDLIPYVKSKKRETKKKVPFVSITDMKQSIKAEIVGFTGFPSPCVDSSRAHSTVLPPGSHSAEWHGCLPAWCVSLCLSLSTYPTHYRHSVMVC